MEALYLQFEGVVYQQMVEILIDWNCAPLIPVLFFILLWFYVSAS